MNFTSLPANFRHSTGSQTSTHGTQSTKSNRSSVSAQSNSSDESEDSTEIDDSMSRRSGSFVSAQSDSFDESEESTETDDNTSRGSFVTTKSDTNGNDSSTTAKTLPSNNSAVSSANPQHVNTAVFFSQFIDAFKNIIKTASKNDLKNMLKDENDEVQNAIMNIQDQIKLSTGPDKSMSYSKEHLQYPLLQKMLAKEYRKRSSFLFYMSDSSLILKIKGFFPDSSKQELIDNNANDEKTAMEALKNATKVYKENIEMLYLIHTNNPYSSQNNSGSGLKNDAYNMFFKISVPNKDENKTSILDSEGIKTFVAKLKVLSKMPVASPPADDKVEKLINVLYQMCFTTTYKSHSKQDMQIYHDNLPFLRPFLLGKIKRYNTDRKYYLVDATTTLKMLNTINEPQNNRKLIAQSVHNHCHDNCHDKGLEYTYVPDLLYSTMMKMIQDTKNKDNTDNPKVKTIGVTDTSAYNLTHLLPFGFITTKIIEKNYDQQYTSKYVSMRKKLNNISSNHNTTLRTALNDKTTNDIKNDSIIFDYRLLQPKIFDYSSDSFQQTICDSVKKTNSSVNETTLTGTLDETFFEHPFSSTATEEIDQQIITLFKAIKKQKEDASSSAHAPEKIKVDFILFGQLINEFVDFEEMTTWKSIKDSIGSIFNNTSQMIRLYRSPGTDLRVNVNKYFIVFCYFCHKTEIRLDDEKITDPFDILGNTKKSFSTSLFHSESEMVTENCLFYHLIKHKVQNYVDHLWNETVKVMDQYVLRNKTDLNTFWESNNNISKDDFTKLMTELFIEETNETLQQHSKTAFYVLQEKFKLVAEPEPEQEAEPESKPEDTTNLFKILSLYSSWLQPRKSIKTNQNNVNPFDQKKGGSSNELKVNPMIQNKTESKRKKKTKNKKQKKNSAKKVTK